MGGEGGAKEGIHAKRWVKAMPWGTTTDLREMTGNFSSLATEFILWMRGDDARSPLCRVLKAR